ncbi:MAG TPA: zinc ribbon domain-containing protein [bacterium]|nr:zinc ribbon domain-containing protein [bacterium]
MSKCPECGREIDIKENRCPSCGATTARALPKQKKIAVDARLADNGKVEMTPSNCEACGAEMQYDPARRMFVCPYCSAVSVLDQSTEETPYYFPFTVEFRDLKKIVREEYGLDEIDPARADPKRQLSVRRLYLPFLLLNGVGRVRYEYSEKAAFIRTRNKDTYHHVFENVLIPLSSVRKYRHVDLNSYRSFSEEGIAPVTATLEKLCDLVVKPTEIPDAKKSAEVMFKNETIVGFENQIPSDTTVHSSTADVQQMSVRMVYLPFWEVRHKGWFLTHRAMVKGVKDQPAETVHLSTPGSSGYLWMILAAILCFTLGAMLIKHFFAG